MPKRIPHWADHFDPTQTNKSQFYSTFASSWRQGYWLALQVKRFGTVLIDRKGLLVVVWAKPSDIGFTFDKNGVQHPTKYITAIWTYGRLDTIHPGHPSRTKR